MKRQDTTFLEEPFFIFLFFFGVGAGWGMGLKSKWQLTFEMSQETCSFNIQN